MQRSLEPCSPARIPTSGTASTTATAGSVLRTARLVSFDTLTPLLGVLITALVARRAGEIGITNAVVPIASAIFLLGVVAMTIRAPHLLIAAMIPIFVSLPMLKALFVPWIGPLKDALVIAASLGAAALIVQRRNAGEAQRGDHVLLAVAAAILGLYIINLGGGLEPGTYDSAWMHGVRLTAEPLLLLVLGLLVPQARKAFRWGMVSLAATAVGVALVGLWQQRVGEWGLVGLGYEWDLHVRTVYGRLRSFGSLDDPFAYAAFLLSGIVAVVFFIRRSFLAAAALAVILAGLAFGYVRTSSIVLVALAGLWLARKRHVAVAVLILLASGVAGVVVLLANTEVSENRVVQADANTYLTINGRTQVWKETLANPSDWLFGKGVGEVGTAAERAAFGVYRSTDDAEVDVGAAVDNGYLAAIADTGLVGLALLVVLLARLAQLSVRAIRDGLEAGWVSAALLVVLLLDAVTRASFQAFPTAFVTLPLIGLALNAAEEHRRAQWES